MIRFFFIFLCFLLFSCIARKGVVGNYSRTYETLSLLKDSTFYYQYRFEQPSAKAFGNWRFIGNNMILLKSKFNLNSFPMKVIEHKTKEKGTRIIFVPEDSIRYSYIKNKIKMSYTIDSNLVIRDASENLVVQRDHIVSIKVTFNFLPNEKLHFPYLHNDEVKTIIYDVIDKNANCFTLLIPLDFDAFFATEVNDVIELKSGNVFWKNKGLPFFRRVKKK